MIIIIIEKILSGAELDQLTNHLLAVIFFSFSYKLSFVVVEVNEINLLFKELLTLKNKYALFCFN